MYETREYPMTLSAKPPLLHGGTPQLVDWHKDLFTGIEIWLLLSKVLHSVNCSREDIYIYVYLQLFLVRFYSTALVPFQSGEGGLEILNILRSKDNGPEGKILGSITVEKARTIMA